MSWFDVVVSDLTQLPNALSHYEQELQSAKQEVKLTGIIERSASTLPGIMENRFSQLQEIEAILEYLNIQERKTRRKFFKKYLENYPRALSSRDVEKYVDGEQDVVDLAILINEVALMRNKWLSIIKGLEQKSFMLGHITRLRTAGLEDARL